MKLGFVTATLGGILACTPTPAPEPPKPDQPGCAEACANMRDLGCDLAKPTPRGASCLDVCRRVAEEQMGIGFNAPCLARVMSCEETENCR
jgi:hypothetical protein